MVVSMSRDIGQYLTAEEARRIDEAAARESHEAATNPASLEVACEASERHPISRNYRGRVPTPSLCDDGVEMLQDTYNLGFGMLHNLYSLLGLE